MRNDNHEEIIFLLSTIDDINVSTEIQYTRIFYDFLSFSPECDIDNYVRYLKF